MLDLPAPLADLDGRIRLRLHSFVPIGEDWRIIARISTGHR